MKDKVIKWKSLGNGNIVLFYSDGVKVLISEKTFYIYFLAITHLSREKLLKHCSIEENYVWKDIVCINGEVFAEEFSISGEMDNDEVYQVDDFIESVAKKHGVSPDEVETYMLDNIEFDPAEVSFGAEECGCYINGVAEWLIYPGE